MFLFKQTRTVNSSMEETDRLSELPEPIIHHIFSFMSSKEAIQNSVLSRKFRSACLSLPAISLELYLRTDSEGRFTTEILNGVHEFFRRHSPDITLERFQFHIRVFGGHREQFYDHRIDSAIEIAIEKSVKELDLRFGLNRRFKGHHRLPISVLSAQSLAVLMLNGFKTERKNLVLNLRNLENLSMVNCPGIETLMVSCSKLKIMKIDYCEVLESVEIHAPNLDSLKIKGADRRQFNLAENFLSECKSVKYLKLAKFEMSEDSMWGISKLEKLETLKLIECNSLKILQIWSPNLQRIKLKSWGELETIVVSSPNLQSFKCYSVFSVQCKIDITACKFLKEVELVNVPVKDRWLERNISELDSLEDLKLSECNKLEKFSIQNSNLKRIEIDRCWRLKVGEINVRCLVSAKLSVKQNVATHLIVHSSQANVVIRLDSSQGNDDLKELRDTLSFFGHCRELKLLCNSDKVLIFHEDSREKFVSPLYDLLCLKVELNLPIKELCELVDNLLWFAPRISFLSVMSNSSKEKCLKFQYFEKPLEELYKDLSCCYSKHVKCWRDDLKEVIMKNFELTEVMILSNFFREKAIRLEKIITLPISETKSISHSR